ncbi:MAG TPA: beta-propeller fold lactonase family protein [Terracidiphilus sp.]|nr:beta-propeller fold lactonase family protein [Terracidiphilus sp.]
MKLSKSSQLVLASAIALVLATFFTACNLVTIDYVFVASAAGSASGTAGQIYTYAVDGSSGALRSVNKPTATGGAGPIAMATTSDYYNLYVANTGNNSVVHFAISPYSGALTQKETITLAAKPSAVAVNSAGTYLYVVSGTTSATLTEYALSSGVIGSPAATISLTVPGFTSDMLVPTGVAALPNGKGVYVAAYDKSAYNPGGTTTSDANPGWLFGFAAGSGGSLTPVAGSPYQSGVKPSAITSDPVSRFVFVTDYSSNEIIGYTVLTNQALQFMVNGPFKTGNEPSSIAIDPRGLFIYLSNSLDETVSAYSIALPTGTPSADVSTAGNAAITTDTDPVSITVEPALGRFVYTANYEGNSVSGFKLNPSDGTIQQTQATPYPTGTNPTVVIAVPHGNHPLSSPE